MRLEELRNILLSERDGGKLVEVAAGTFEGARQYLEELHERVYQIPDPLSEEIQALREEIESIRGTMQDIFQIRLRKILYLARTHAEGEEDREEMKRMLPEELTMYRSIVGSITACRNALTGTRSLPRAVAIAAPPPVEEPVPEEPAPGKGAESPLETAMVRILEDLEPFVGVDGRVYHLKKEDLVTLPKEHAELLCARNIALNINPGT